MRGPGAARAAALDLARRLALAHQSAWHDPFLVGQVDRFLAWSPDQQAAKVSADSIRRAGITLSRPGGAPAGIAVWRDALARAVSIGDSAGMAGTLSNIGSGFLTNSALDSAQHYLEQLTRYCSPLAIGNLPGLRQRHLRVQVRRARSGTILGAHDNATPGAISLRQATGDTRGLAADYNNLGGLAQQLGDLDAARHDFEAALDLNQRNGRDEIAATNMVNLAGLAALNGDFARADHLYRTALCGMAPTREQWADVAARDARSSAAWACARRGDYPAGRSRLDRSARAASIYDRTGPIAGALAVGRMLADTRAAMGNLQGALDELRHDQLSADSGQVPYDVRGGITLARADLAVRLNQRPDAERLYEAATQLFVRAGSRGGAGLEAQQG